MNDLFKELKLTYSFQIDIKNFLLNFLFDTFSFQFRLNITGSYLNQSVKVWEPFFESSEFIGGYGLIIDKISKEKAKNFYISLDETITQSIEFTITDDQVKYIFHLY